MTAEPAPFKLVLASDDGAWDNYVRNHPNGTVYHLWAAGSTINKTYGHDVYFLGAVETPKVGASRSILRRGVHSPEHGPAPRPPQLPNEGLDASDVRGGQKLVGVMPLVHVRHAFFGNSLVSMPYFDTGGILADSDAAEEFLMGQAANIAARVGAREVELRHTSPRQGAGAGTNPMNGGIRIFTRSHKVRMVLKLPEHADLLMKTFKSKLRSQINKTIRDGLQATVGGEELIDDFYRVFSVNMRDLGSPVHSRRFIASFFSAFAGQARVVVVYQDGRCLAGGLVVGSGGTLANPWASSLRTSKSLNPNMLLYWTMLKFACDQQYRYFDFGRSTPDEGTFKFKEQWGARPEPLFWHYIPASGVHGTPSDIQSESTLDLARKIWMRLPVGLTRLIGPHVRKYISL